MAPTVPSSSAAAAQSSAADRTSTSSSSDEESETIWCDRDTMLWSMPGSHHAYPSARQSLPLPAVAEVRKSKRRGPSILWVGAGIFVALAALLACAFLIVRSKNRGAEPQSQSQASLSGTAAATDSTTAATAAGAADVAGEAIPTIAVVATAAPVLVPVTAAPVVLTPLPTPSIAVPTAVVVTTGLPTPSSPITTVAAVDTSLPASVVTPADSTAPGKVKCYNLYSSLTVNPLQAYPDNPDSAAQGYTDLKLCTNGTMYSSSIVYSGRSQIIAVHIHLSKTSNGAYGSGLTDEGPPVINFCGNNDKGLLQDGTPYTQACKQWDRGFVASNKNVPGVLVSALNKGFTAEARVKDIVARPAAYYFNFHTLAEWTHSFPTPHGICRGPLQFLNEDPQT